MPLAVSATTFSGFSTDEVDERVDVLGERGEGVVAAGDGARRGRPGAGPRAVAASISFSPVSSPMGLAPARQSLMPLYSAGLCEAVNIAPGASKWPAAK